MATSGKNADTKQSQNTIRRQLLLAVNLPMAVLAVIFLSYDYQRDLGERLSEKQMSLEEEANTLLPAVAHLHAHSVTATQQYIDAVCGVMRSENSPGHHIAVHLPGAVLQSKSHGRALSATLAALQHTADPSNRRALFANTEFIVGVAVGEDATIYVAEILTHVKHMVRTDVLRRLAGLAIAFFVAALLVNLVLFRAVTHPIQRLVTTVQQIGRGQLGVRPESFRSSELNYLAREIDSMSASLAAADRVHKSHMAKARDIQQHLLPKDVSTPGLRIAHLFQPADEIGGDYYDILPLKDGTWLICVADVTGHGIPAALSAAMLKTLLMQAAESHTSPAELLGVVNRQFVAVSLMEDFVSMILLRVEPQAARLQYASAGHEPGWLISSPEKSRELSSTGLLLGIDEEATWYEVTIETTVGDRLIALTDGVSETFNSQGEMFGRTRLFALLSECRGLTTEQTIQQFDQALLAFRGDAPQHDDVTAVLLEIA